MDLDLFIERLLELKKQGLNRVYMRPSSYYRGAMKVTKIDTDQQSDVILIGEPS